MPLGQGMVSRYNTGGNNSGNFWSSTENNADNAWNMNFNNGNANNNNKTNNNRVRAVLAYRNNTVKASK